MSQIYLDHNASTPIDPRVAAVMRPLLESGFGNPSSRHWVGVLAREAVEHARAQVAAFLGCAPDEVVFTSGGSEANNPALKGVFFAHRDRGDHLITTAVEHPAILEPCRFLERLGARVTYLPVDRTSRIDPDDLRKAITPTVAGARLGLRNARGREVLRGRLAVPVVVDGQAVTLTGRSVAPGLERRYLNLPPPPGLPGVDLHGPGDRTITPTRGYSHVGCPCPPRSEAARAAQLQASGMARHDQ